MSTEPKCRMFWFIMLVIFAFVALLGGTFARCEFLAARVSASEIRAERIQAQYEEVIRRLDRIEAKLDRRP